MEDCLTINLIKNGLYIPAFLMAVGLEEQTSWGIFVLTVFMLLDVVVGVLASYKIDGKKSIKSRKATAGVVAKGMIVLIPMIISLTGKGIGMDMNFWNRGFLSVLILSELYSILGNIHSFKVGIRMPEIDAVSLVLGRIRKVVLDILEKTKIE